MANSTDNFTSDNNANDTVRPSQLGKLDTKPLINEETIVARLNKNAVLLETLAEDLVYKGITIPLPGDKAYNTKLDTVLEEDSEKKKNDGAAKLKDNIFNTPAALEKYINFATTVEESENRLHF